jgi:hypothetical protein
MSTLDKRRFCVHRQVRSIPLWNFSTENWSGKQRSVPVTTAFTNVMYLYPLTLEKSQHRNIAIKVGPVAVFHPAGCEQILNVATWLLRGS